MMPHQERVVTEKKELDEKLEKLGIFIDCNPTFGVLLDEDQKLMRDQRAAMKEYSKILGQRIERFEIQ